MSALKTLHEEDQSPNVELCLAEQLERLLSGCAAAVFSVTPGQGGVVTRRAAGPRWRTAEREGPTRAALERLGLADLVRSGVAVDGTLAAPGPLFQARSGIELIHRPVMVRGCRWGALVVLRPSDSASTLEDVWLIEACAAHLGVALGRAARTGPAVSDVRGPTSGWPPGDTSDLERVRVDLQHYLRAILAVLEPCLVVLPAEDGLRGALEAAVVATLEAAAYTSRLGGSSPGGTQAPDPAVD